MTVTFLSLIANMTRADRICWLIILTIIVVFSLAFLCEFLAPDVVDTVSSWYRQHRIQRRNTYEARRRHELSAIVISGQFGKGRR